MASIGDLVVRLSANAKPLQQGLASAQSSVANFGSTVGKSMVVAGVGVASAVAAVATGGAAFAVGVAAEAETLRTQFTVLLKDATAAQEMMEKINTFASQTPLSTDEIGQAAKQLLALGSSSDEVIGELRMLGDIGTGLGIPLVEIADLYGKARSQGRLFGEDINQLSGRGIPIIENLATVLGVSETQVRALVSEGKVGFAEMSQAMKLMTTQGGDFEGMMQTMAQTTTGKWSTFKDTLMAIVRTIGEALLPAANLLLDWGTACAEKFLMLVKIGTFVFSNIGLSIKAMWETAKDYTLAAFNYVVQVAPVMAQNVATAVKNVFLQLAVEMHRIGEDMMFWLGLSEEVMAIPDAIGQGMQALPQFKAPALGPAGQQLAKELEKIMGGAVDEGLDMSALENPANRMGTEGGGGGVGGRSGERKFANAMEKGSSEAFSAILANMLGGGDPQVSAINHLGGIVKNNVGKPLQQIAKNTKPQFAPEFV